MNIFGHWGKYLSIDLNKSIIEEVDLSENKYRSFLGGYGLGVSILYKEIPKEIDPLGEENVLGFFPGLLTGTISPFTGRYMVCSKSPLTNTWGDANSGGFFGPAIKRAGYDAIIIKGASKEPCYIHIGKESIDILNAKSLWGLDVIETEGVLKNIHKKSANIASIGSAGEKLSLMAGIVNDGGRIAARGGLGAVMGSKKLKAICITRSKKISMSEKNKALEFSRKYNSAIKNKYQSSSTELIAKYIPKFAFLLRWAKMAAKGDEYLYAHTLKKYGTSFITSISSEIGDLPIKNYKGIGHIDWPSKISNKFSGPNLLKYKTKSYACFGCPLGCGAVLNVPECGFEETHRPEFETLGALGGLILNPDVGVVIEANDFLNRSGMDTISAGAVISFVLECVEMGILSKNDFITEKFPEGFLPQWGNSDYIMPLLNIIVHREGIGNILADGVKIAAQKINKKSKNVAFHAGGQELPMHDARLNPEMMLTYIIDPTPGRHTASSIDHMSQGPLNNFLENVEFHNSDDPKIKGKEHGRFSKLNQALNSLGFCQYALWMGKYPLLELIEANLGWKMSIDELFTIGHRIQTMRQLFNQKHGVLNKIFDEIPESRAFGNPPLKAGPLKNKTISAEKLSIMRNAYFKEMDFDKNGNPSSSILKNLKIDDYDE